jgi:SAM-dependent methyltransferase
MRRINERAYVREQYETEDRLRARKAAYKKAEGDDPREFAFEAIAEARPRQVLEVGGGEGELAERIVNELRAELVAIDQSERMVELQRSKGIDASVGDVQELPFANAEFDVAVAAWVLFHVPDLGRAVAELARTNPHSRFNFRSENGAEILERHFRHVERRDAQGATTMDPNTIRRFAASSENLAALAAVADRGETVRVRTHSTIFVAVGPA